VGPRGIDGSPQPARAGAESPEGEPWGWGPAALMGVLNPPAGAESPEGEPWLWGPAALKLSYRYCR